VWPQSKKLKGNKAFHECPMLQVVKVKIKVKISLFQAVEAHRVARG
jgi:hypothetical protein